LLLKHGANAASRIAGFEPVSERVREKIVLCAFLYAFKAFSRISWILGDVEGGRVVDMRGSEELRGG
jgi:hypothetical protein